MPTGNKNILYACRNCGSKFSPQSTGGMCPYCKTADPELIGIANKNHRRRQKLKKQLKKAFIRVSVFLILLIAVIISSIAIISSVVKSNNTLIFDTEEPDTYPCFYSNSDGNLYVSFDSQSYLIGKGRIGDLAHSDKNNITFAVFEGSMNPDSSVSGSFLLKITDNGKSIDTVAETYYGTISFVQGGNCEYIYYTVNEILSSYQSPSYLYVYRSDEEKPIKIDEYDSGEYFSNFRVSPNGKYLIYKAKDESGSKLMKYSANSGTKEPLGIKNGEPVSIDNKGICYSYIKNNTENGLASFYVETNAADREEIPLPASYAKTICVSADCRSFVIDSGYITTVKQFGMQYVETASHDGKIIGIDAYDDLTFYDPSPIVRSGVQTLKLCKNSSFFPYYYISDKESGSTIVWYNSDGSSGELVESGFDSICTNGKVAAYIFDNALYTMNIDVKSPKITLASENFGEFSLSGISPNGKYIFFRDENDNLNRIPFKYNGSDWTVMAFDPQEYSSSADAKHIIFISSNTLHYVKNNKSAKIADTVEPTGVYTSETCKKGFCLAKSDTSKAENSYALYFFSGKKTEKISDNVTQLYMPARLSIMSSDTFVYNAPMKAVTNNELAEEDNPEADNDEISPDNA